MPGIPRSKACRNCKARRIKCDQKWPTCTQCIRKKLECPGPSSLVKYIHVSPSGGGSTEAWSETPPGSLVDLSDEQGGLGEAPKRLSKDTLRFYFYHSAPSPDRNLTSIGDHVAARLVTHMQSAPERGLILRKKYLKYLPRCLESVPALRDSINLFCSVWHNYHSGGNYRDFTQLPEYTRAIRSLRYTLAQGEKAITVETLAAITILGRTENLFRCGGPSFVHELGIASLNERLGPPKPGDEFHTTIVVENYTILVPYWIKKNKQSFMEKGPWREAVMNAIAEIVEEPALRPYLKSTYNGYCELYTCIPRFYQALYVIHSNADKDDPPVRSLARSLMNELQEWLNTTTDANDKLFQKMKELKLVVEVNNPKSVIGGRYYITDMSLFQSYLGLATIQIVVLRMLYGCGMAYPEYTDPAVLWPLFRKHCVHIWKFIPTLLELEAFVAAASLESIYPTIDAANRKEKDYILDCIASLDRFSQTWPTDRGLLEDAIISCSSLYVGRIFPPYFNKFSHEWDEGSTETPPTEYQDQLSP